MVRTAIKTMKRGGGATDFLADLDLQTLIPGMIYAVKNNSRNMFFDIRESTYEVVRNKQKEFFSSIRSIALFTKFGNIVSLGPICGNSRS